MLDVVFIPIFQARTGNGGIGVLVSFAVSEFVVFAGGILSLPKGTLGLGALADVARAVAAAAGTVVLFRLAPPIPWFLSIPLCVVTFAVATVALGLISRGDLARLQEVLRARRAS